MPKFILKKDLPFAKTGSEVVIEGTIGWRCVYVVIDNIPLDSQQKIPITFGNSIKSLFDEGWIEEVKPDLFEKDILKCVQYPHYNGNTLIGISESTEKELSKHNLEIKIVPKEEKKPREFSIAISHKGQIEIVKPTHFFLDEQPEIKEIIKVREVI